jgi:hypothetical protein
VRPFLGQANLTNGIGSITITPAAAGTETITLHYIVDYDDQSSTGTYNLTEVQRIIAIGEAQAFGTVSSQCPRQQTCLLCMQIWCRIESVTGNAITLSAKPGLGQKALKQVGLQCHCIATSINRYAAPRQSMF